MTTRTTRTMVAAGLAVAAALFATGTDPAVAAAGDITTIAGGNSEGYAGGNGFGYTGDGGPAATAQLGGPFGVAFDGAGNLYIADYGNHAVRRGPVRSRPPVSAKGSRPPMSARTWSAPRATT